MRQQLITDESRTEGEAMSLVRQLSSDARAMHTGPDRDPARQAVLTRTVEEQVIPRLLRAPRLQVVAQTGAATGPARPTARHVAELLRVVLDGDQADADRYVEMMQDGGTPTESLLLDLMTPVARQLGAMWEDDTCSFSDVTLGLIRLGNVLRRLGGTFADTYDPARAGPTALLAQMPGEQHGFGLSMLVQFFRRAGWNVCHEPAASSEGLAGIVERHWFGIVGISVACSDRLETLAADIAAIRRRSRNRELRVMVGGPPFVAHPQLAEMVGADATASDGRQAVQRAESLIGALARGR